jgi:hypothetical protein
MNRMVWFAAGAGAGVYAMVRARRAAEVLTPEGLSDRLAGLSVGLRLLRDEVSTGMVEKENDLRERLGITLAGSHRAELSGPRSAPTDHAADIPARSTSAAETTREGND